jgi:hypothetical protein
MFSELGTDDVLLDLTSMVLSPHNVEKETGFFSLGVVFTVAQVHTASFGLGPSDSVDKSH